jgi:hypothetical protein
MPKLFWKIFLWFWGAMLIVNCAIVFSIFLIRSVSEQNRFKQFAQSKMALQARQAAEILSNPLLPLKWPVRRQAMRALSLK